MNVQNNHTWPSCVGLTWQGGNWLNATNRTEVWTDLSSRKWPLHLRYLPTKWVTWDTNGARLKIFKRNKKNEFRKY